MGLCVFYSGVRGLCGSHGSPLCPTPTALVSSDEFHISRAAWPTGNDPEGKVLALAGNCTVLLLWLLVAVVFSLPL